MQINQLPDETILVVSYYAESGKFSNLFCTRDVQFALNQIQTLTKSFTKENPGWFEPVLSTIRLPSGEIYYAVWENSNMDSLLGRFFISEVEVLPYLTSRTLN
jgi:hypothetical protein